MDALLKTKIGSLEFAVPIFNASGVWCTTKKELMELGKSEAGAIVFKSMTIKPRQGNPEPRLYIGEKISVNSMGLPNLGVDYYNKIAESLKKYKKPLIASIAGFSEEEYNFLFNKVDNYPYDAIEINLSCPNLVGKSIFAYDIKTSLRILKKIKSKTKKIIGVKLPPYNDRGEIQIMAEGLVEAGVNFATLINSVPLGCVIDYKSETMMIKPNMGIGGLGGEVIKPIALAQIVLFRHFSKGKLDLIGVGGVNKGSDVYEYILAGASAVAVATALQRKGVGIFGRLKKELMELLKKKKVKSLKEKIGSLKENGQ